MRFLALLLFALSSRLFAQNFLGTWQGTLHADQSDTRIVVEIVEPSGTTAPSAHIYLPDQGPEPTRADTLSLAGNHLQFAVTAFGASYDATLSSDGQTLDGTLTQGAVSPLKFVRASGKELWIDPKVHGTSALVTVAPGVKLEVVDWGGTGRALLLLSGLGNTAHIFDRFAQKLTPHFHVMGITRRGFGDSSIPSTADHMNYSADRLGDDVLAVMTASHISRPVLIGHSIAGEELSSVASRHPEAVSALVYLDAGFPYAFYDPAVGDFTLDLLDLQTKVAALLPGAGDADPGKTIAAVQALLPILQHDLADRGEMLSFMPPPPPKPASDRAGAAVLTPGDAITLGVQKYTRISSPTLAIFAVPHDLRPMISKDPKALAAAEANDEKRMSALSNSFARGVPTARVVRLPNASHYVFLSNEADVIREIDSFLAPHP